MCFRPAEVQAPQVCPECGKECAVIAGIYQKNCPFCGAVMPDPEAEAPAPSSAPPVPASGAPSAPAPGAPTAPNAPSAPSAPTK